MPMPHKPKMIEINCEWCDREEKHGYNSPGEKPKRFRINPEFKNLISHLPLRNMPA